ncbi:ABC transporter permease [Oceaniradius stylonematis]|jgi:simple sugar transport system permease protein|uniref:ABC transporter permease n=1 Tax=Oceaniradius stylonematis TaxID=2184161 RepID=A0A3A8AFA0_9HYPH|nr:ABC transporter permease [Oceaniradius stylonematis]RKF07739.1 ABC transporter permease [Oceaniradius stylonematis]RNC95907.1 MAG: ABC transporter permease [Oricola sp.]
MGGLLTEAFLSSLLTGAIVAAVPILLAGLGEQMSEKAGVLNVGIEGMMLMGAYTGFLAAFQTSSLWLGFLGGILGGLLTALVMAILCVRMGLNQIVIGIGLTLGAEGLTALLHHFQFSRSYPRLPAPERLDIPGLTDLPVIGPSLFARHPIVYFALLAVVVLALLYRRTNLGMTLRAAGERPAALDVAGGNVVGIRLAAVLFTGAMAGLGGAYLANIAAGLFIPFMTGGAGFIGIVLAMLARGRPLWVLIGALIFGAALSLTTALQVAGSTMPTEVIQMLPFAAVMLVLVLFGRRAKLPSALAVSYERGAR